MPLQNLSLNQYAFHSTLSGKGPLPPKWIPYGNF
jgi:hypothetical protein